MPGMSRRVTRTRKRWRPRGGLMLALAIIAPVTALVAAAVPGTSSLAAMIRPAAATSVAAPAAVPGPPAGWSTVFSDDFNGTAGSGVDSQWMYDTGPGANFGTGEIETMTNSASNVHLDGNGNLDITAQGGGSSWTSGRVQTTSANVGAPAGGELEVTASIKQPVGPCNEPNGIGSGLRACGGCQSGFRTYSMILNRTNPANESITYYLDGNQYFSVSESQVGTAAWQAADDHNLSIILDLAMGGGFPNGVCNCTTPTSSTASGGTMSVAYVAAYSTSGGGSGGGGGGGGGGTGDGTTVDLYDCNRTAAQVFIPQSNGELYNPQSNKCLDDTGYGGSGTHLQIWDCADTANQQWKLP